uniref:WH1 domain-containing protein n=1 Tax=Parastrongyloides trichosuri TaxID=131310 RepID=A0A0N4Z8S9_PARTI
MSESILAQATAQIYLFDRTTKRWITPDGIDTTNDPSSTNQLAQILLLHHAGRRSFRIVGMQRDGRGMIIETKLFARIKYQKANDTFHQWRDEQKQVFGVNFADNYEASIFYQNVIKVLGTIEDNPNIDPGGELYQDPATISNGRMSLQQNGMVNGNGIYSNGMNHDVDQDSLASSNSHGYLNGTNSQMSAQIHAMSNAGVMRKGSNYGVGIQQQQSNSNLLASQQQNQRRASQGSSGSSTNSSNNYITSNNGGGCNNISRSAPAPPPPPPPTKNNSNNISSNNPPPPPPPPLPINLKNENKGNSLAEQLKKTQLKKVSSVENTNNINNINNQGITHKNSINASKGDLLSELAAKINKRKNQEEVRSNGSGDSVTTGTINNERKQSENSVINQNGNTLVQNTSTSNLRTWKQQNSNNGDNNISNGTDSPKTHRKIPSVSSLSSQEDPLKNSNNSSSPITNVTLADLERHKQEVLTEVQKKLQSFKLEIVQEVVAAIRNELRNCQ